LAVLDIFRREAITSGMLDAGQLYSATCAAIYFCLHPLCKLSDLLSVLETSFCCSCWL